jgi:capsular exopolysaccharide synthesis family protein
MDEKLPEKNELKSLNIKDLFFKYIRFLPLFIISIALSLFVAYVYLRYATLVYRASGSLVIRDEKAGGSGDEKFDQLFYSDNKKNIQSEIEVLKSRPLMERVVRALNINFTYYAKGKIKELHIYKNRPFDVQALELADSSRFVMKIQFEDQSRFRINGESKLFTFGDVFKNSNGVFRINRNAEFAIADEYKVEWNPTPSAARALASSVLVVPRANTGILVILLESTNAAMAADVVNQLMLEYQKQTVEEKNATTQQTKEFIDGRLGVVSNELDSVAERKINYQQSENLISPELQTDSYFERIGQMDAEINVQRTQLTAAEMIEDYLRNSRNNYERVPTSLGLQDVTLNNLIAAYNVSQMERKDLLESKVAPGSALVREKEEEIEKYRKNILENIRNIKSSINAVIADIQGKNRSVQGQLRALPSKQQVLINIERELQSKLAVFNYLMEKREESAIALASTISNTKVLENAFEINSPVKPNRKNAQMLAIVVGFALPALFIFVLEIMNDKVTTRNDIERLTTTAILGEVGHSYNRETLVATPNNRSVIAEQFRIIRSNLAYVVNNMKKPVILVTSSFSGEGKSFISTNIGAVMALAGKRTIILEFDIRKPKILSQLFISKKPGVTNYLLGKVGLDELPLEVPGQPNLYVLPCGPIPPNPAEMLLDPKLNDLFVYLREKFDVIVMDTAPVGMVSDAMTLSKFADCTLYIVRQGHTYKKQISLIDAFHREGKLPRTSIILNDVKVRTGYGYYGYGRYGYGYSYGQGSGYFEEEEQPQTALTKWFGWLDMKKWKTKKKKRTTA